MAILSTTHIHINGNKLPYYNSCSLHQEIGEHHTLDLYCLLETIEKFCTDNKQEMEELLGTVITIETKSYADIKFHGTLKFKGIITGLSYQKGLFSNEGDLILIKAKSPTIIADDGPHHTSFNDKSFIDIIEDTFGNYDTSRLKINAQNSKLSEPILYTVQYNESCFKFAQRMAARNGEWMYYNGEELLFGNNPNTEEIQLVLGRDLQDLNTTLTPIPQNFNYLTNDYLTDDIHESPSSSSNSVTEGSYGVMNNSATELYTNPTNIWVHSLDDANSKNRLDRIVALQQNALQTNQIKVSGTSDNPGVQLGSVIKISQNNYRITSVTHSYSNNGEYENFFEAISTNIDAYPKTNINAFPKAQSQTAVIKENHDPDGIGRVKVQFPWQKADGLTTHWIRCISPSASKGQGLFFIPEVNDEVLVDFEGGNAEAPFVMGSVYNSQATPPDGSSNSSNHVKMFKSRSGSFLKLNDEDGSITLQDKAGSSIVLDGSGNISITAASDEVSITAPSEISLSSNDEVSINGRKEVSVVSGDEVSINGGTEVSVVSGNEVSINGGTEVNIIGGMEANLSATKIAVNGTAMTEIKGGQVKLN